ncbi:MAG: WGR domain-containing protein [Promethearchaeota archaeon]
MSRDVLSTGRFELKEPKNNRHEFWVAEVQGKYVTIKFGKVGSKGYTATREFNSPDEADKFVAYRLKTQIEKGYKRV